VHRLVVSAIVDLMPATCSISDNDGIVSRLSD
jgi:hypothetical protein